jgi:hypothetical protein
MGGTQCTAGIFLLLPHTHRGPLINTTDTQTLEARVRHLLGSLSAAGPLVRTCGNRIASREASGDTAMHKLRIVTLGFRTSDRECSLDKSQTFASYV